MNVQGPGEPDHTLGEVPAGNQANGSLNHKNNTKNPVLAYKNSPVCRTRKETGWISYPVHIPVRKQTNTKRVY